MLTAPGNEVYDVELPRTAPKRRDRRDGEPAAHATGRIVVVRDDVLDTMGHVLGNLFQRLYHLVDRVAEQDASTAEELRGNAGRLEGVLQQFLDYVSPLAPELEAVPVAEIAASVTRCLSDACAGRVEILSGSVPPGSALVDPGRLARAFALLAARLQPPIGAEDVSAVRVDSEAGGGGLLVRVIVPSVCLAVPSSEGELRWALAEKLVELQGGTLVEEGAGPGEKRWLISLPLQR